MPLLKKYFSFILLWNWDMGEGWLKKELGCFWNNNVFFFFLILFFERSLENIEKNNMKLVHAWKVSNPIFSQLKVDDGRNNGDVWFEIDARIVFTQVIAHLFKNYVRKYINIFQIKLFVPVSFCNILYSIRFRKSITVSCQSGDRFIFDIGSSSIFHKRFYNPAMKRPALIHR